MWDFMQQILRSGIFLKSCVSETSMKLTHVQIYLVFKEAFFKVGKASVGNNLI